MASFGIAQCRAVWLLPCTFLFSFPVQALTLAEAEQRALAANPALQAMAAESQESVALAKQQTQWENPELSYSRENLGNPLLTGLDGSASTWQLSQRVMWGQSARRAQREAQVELAALSLLQAKQQLLVTLRQTWAEVLVAQENVATAEALLSNSQQMQTAISAQVRSGKESPVALNRMGVAVSRVRNQEQQAVLALQRARQKLAMLQGLDSPDFGELMAQAVPRPALLPRESYSITHSIYQQIQRAEIRSDEAGLRATKAESLPAITLSVGQTRFEEVSGEQAWQFGVALPLPLFNRHSAAREAATARLQATRWRARADEQALQAELDNSYAETAQLLAQLDAMEQQVIPASQAAYQAIQKGYAFGKFGLLDVLDAQRNVLDVRADYAAVLLNYHEKRQRLEQLAGVMGEVK